MKLVEFSNGKFGIKANKGWFSKPKFVDLTNPSSELPIGHKYFNYCMGTRTKAVTTMLYLDVSYRIAEPPREEDFV